ncbi:alpha-1,6-mannosyl-glycoprotein 2-beta-N-acetylglucosaminyltransferase [Beta vulgaris subsp. vulgaris]|uniref:alpha-1,6-mannosyl-glycoprotein 2-beta-N-acetylglucosaminyltransferase n=1 Tax=Beta vulgaris subsp. vulgaris TaxID=3555 RepID=UPI0020370A87|nr:alpha-1,6-mannosyl-glycoprotein 2-beta-N-acetylglucosaminyltransferase [Beta vulgaris subsp. vulgaris]
MSVSAAMAPIKKPSVKVGKFVRFILISVILISVLLWSVSLIRTNFGTNYATGSDENVYKQLPLASFHRRRNIEFPKQNELSKYLEERNRLPPRNLDLYPYLPKDHVVIVLYVHNRPQYLKVVVESLSHVERIKETLLIVSHDGYFEEMNKIVEGIKFCRVKQIYAPYSPHIFPDRFPGVSPLDCKGKDDASEKKCAGNPDQYGNHRSPKIVSLKHHWWWMMNTVWDGLKETKDHLGYILFIEEDHFILPNAYRNLQSLIKLKPEKCSSCYAVNLAPWDVKSRGEGISSLVAERMGNIGYSFNRTVWKRIHNKAEEFCLFDEYNWDITMWSEVYPSFGSPVYTLRGPRSSAVHFGKCGLHQGQGDIDACIDDGSVNIDVQNDDRVMNINSQWDVFFYDHQAGYKAGFKGWGGWGDTRDHQLCLNFASMYHND